VTLRACVALVIPFTLGCSRVHDAWRFFVSECPAAGPVAETKLGLHLEPVDLHRYYEEVRANAHGFEIHELVRIPADGTTYPVYRIGPIGGSTTRRVLVLAGVHGNEIAASLAAPEILRDVRDRPGDYAACELHLVAPADPVGLAHQSRYNAQGCDINRDFEAFQTPEARTIRDVFARVSPTIVVALHEGPQDGFYVIGTRSAAPDLPEEVAKSVSATGVALSTNSFVGTRLANAGYDHEGVVKTFLKRLIGLHTLGAFAEHRGVGTLTTESPWSSTDVPARVRGHVAAVRAVCGRERTSTRTDPR
jgi:hypothetical protein